MNRPLSTSEMSLIRWMLENGVPEANAFLPQLEHLQVTPSRCPCGCATLCFQLIDHDPAPPGVGILGDFFFDDAGLVAGVFLYQSDGLLSGLEVYGLEGEAPRHLPSELMLRSIA